MLQLRRQRTSVVVNVILEHRPNVVSCPIWIVWGVNANAADPHAGCLPDSNISRFRATFFAAHSCFRSMGLSSGACCWCWRRTTKTPPPPTDTSHVTTAPKDAEDIIVEEFAVAVFIAKISLLWAASFFGAKHHPLRFDGTFVCGYGKLLVAARDYSSLQ